MKSKNNKYKVATRLIHGAREPQKQGGLIHPPTFRGSTVEFRDYDQYCDPKDMRTYATKGTPGTDYLQELMISIEEAEEGCAVFHPSGLASIAVLLSGLLKKGDHILVSDGVYYPTRRLCERRLKLWGVEVTYYPPRIAPSDLAALLKPNTRLLYLESPSSLAFEMQDVPGLAAVAKQNGVVTVLDNTWSSGHFFKAFRYDIDYVIYAMTKYQLGHANGLLGAIVCPKRNASRLKNIQETFGSCAGTHEIEQALLGMRTLETRINQHQSNAHKVAKWLETRDEVIHIQFPARENSPDYDLWKRDFSGGAGPFSFCLTTKDQAATKRMYDQLKLIKIGYSWGGIVSLMIPVNPNEARVCSHYEFPGTMFRLHVGLENADDIIEDLQAGVRAYHDEG